MKTHTKYLVILLLGIWGLIVSSYLTYVHFNHVIVPCTITHGCEVVLNSKYSSVLGIPLPVLGLVFYTTVITLSALALKKRLPRKLLALVLPVGGVAALTFLSIQFFVLQQVCQYCLATDLTSVFLFLWELNVTPTDDDQVWDIAHWF